MGKKGGFSRAIENEYFSKEVEGQAKTSQYGAQKGNSEPKKNDVVNIKYVPIETKSRRVGLLMQPSLFASLSEIAKAKGESVNNLIHGVLEDYVKSEGE